MQVQQQIPHLPACATVTMSKKITGSSSYAPGSLSEQESNALLMALIPQSARPDPTAAWMTPFQQPPPPPHPYAGMSPYGYPAYPPSYGGYGPGYGYGAPPGQGQSVVPYGHGMPMVRAGAVDPASLPLDPTEELKETKKRLAELEGRLDSVQTQYNANEKARFEKDKSNEKFFDVIGQHVADAGTDMKGSTFTQQHAQFTIKTFVKKNTIQNPSDSDEDGKPAKKKAKTSKASLKIVKKMKKWQKYNQKKEDKVIKLAKDEHKNARGSIKTEAVTTFNANRKIFGYVYWSKDPYTPASDEDKKAFADYKKSHGIPTGEAWEPSDSDSDTDSS